MRHRTARRRLIEAFAAGLFASAAVGPGAAPAQAASALGVLTFSDALDANLLRRLGRAIGTQVLIDPYLTREAMLLALRTHKPAYDLVLLPLDALRETVKAGLLAPLDPAKLTKAAGILPALAKATASQDTGGPHAAPFDWFPTGIAYNIARIKERQVTLDASNAWEALFRPDLLRRLSDCGIGVPNDPRVIFATALASFGRDPRGANVLDTRRAFASLVQLRLADKRLDSENPTDGIAAGDLCIAMLSAPDAAQARDRARESGNGVDVAFLSPAQGGPLSVDVLGIPVTAPHAAQARRLLAALLQPDNSAENSRFSHLAPAVAIPSGIETGSAAFDETTDLSKLFTVPDYDPLLAKAIDGEWSRVRTNR